jgi:hydroxyacylglutathione hydrolase
MKPSQRDCKALVHTSKVYGMIHEILPVGPLQCNCSIFGDEQTREAMVVDPGAEISRILEILALHSLKVTAIVITHAHIDHIGGAQKLKQATGAPVYMNLNDAELQKMLPVQATWLGMPEPEPVAIDVPAKDGDRILVGATEFHVLHTPGHTQGSISLYAPSEQKLIAGDTLFRDSIGRTDLPGGDGRQIIRSIHQKLMPLPEETIVIPGHGPNSDIGREKRMNPFLQ